MASSARTLLLALTTVFAVACADGKTGTGTDEDPAARTIAYDQAWQISTHNGYWVDRGTPNDFLASGVGERILDQLLLDGVRSIEIDIHADPHRPGSFNVFHTAPGNSLCAECAKRSANLILDAEVGRIIARLPARFAAGRVRQGSMCNARSRSRWF